MSSVPVFINLMSVYNVYACGVEKVGTESHREREKGVNKYNSHTHTHTHTHTPELSVITCMFLSVDDLITMCC